MVSLGTKLCHLGGRLAWVKSNFFSHPLQYIQTCIIWLQLCAVTFRLETWTSIKALSFMSDCLRHCSQGLQDYSWEGLVPVHEPLQHLQLGLGSVFLLPDAELCETPFRSFAGSILVTIPWKNWDSEKATQSWGFILYLSCFRAQALHYIASLVGNILPET